MNIPLPTLPPHPSRHQVLCCWIDHLSAAIDRRKVKATTASLAEIDTLYHMRQELRLALELNKDEVAERMKVLRGIDEELAAASLKILRLVGASIKNPLT